MFVKPARGLRVIDPISRRPLPDEGKKVPRSTYWLRRIASGDVLVLNDSVIPDSSEGS